VRRRVVEWLVRAAVRADGDAASADDDDEDMASETELHGGLEGGTDAAINVLQVRGDRFCAGVRGNSEPRIGALETVRNSAALTLTRADTHGPVTTGDD